MGGTPTKAAAIEAVSFPGVTVHLHMNQATSPTGGTVGTVIDHVGFTVQDLQEATARWKAAGVPVLPGMNGRTDQAFVVTPDELRIEILEDPTQKAPIQHHHVHFFVPQSAIPDIQAWYAKVFGAAPGVRAQYQVADLPGVNLSFSPSQTPTVHTKGRVLDHIGFSVTNLEAFIRKLEAAGIQLDRPYAKNAQTRTARAYLFDPWGTYIELLERTGS